MDDDTEEAVAAFAQDFADLLIDRDYDGARALLHPELAAMTAAQLREDFEAIFQDEDDWPESATVQDIQDDGVDRIPGDLAWVYVTLDSLEAEAVSFVVNRSGATFTVRALEFGRP